MGPGTKNRQKRTADLCKESLRTGFRAQSSLVEEFIREVEGADEDVVRWQRFVGPSWKDEETLKRVGEAFQLWLRGEG